MNERRGWSYETHGCPNFYHGFTTVYYTPFEFDPGCSACVNRRRKEETHE